MNVRLVAVAQAVEHYEITRYGALIAWVGDDTLSRTGLALARRWQSACLEIFA